MDSISVPVSSIPSINKLHRETDSATRGPYQQKFGNIMYGWVDPTITLWEANMESIGHDGFANRFGEKIFLRLGKGLSIRVVR